MNKFFQHQKAGDNANQYQADTIIVQNGIDEKRAREICTEMFDIVRRDLSAEAYEIACRRVDEFENDLIPKMQKIDGALNAFADPSLQFMVTSAHRTAASTDRPDDYALLSELLIHRIQHGQTRATTSGISRAIEIVDKISDEALLGLSVAFAVERIRPCSGGLAQGLDTLDLLFSNLCYSSLPKGSDWLDHLDILDAVRLSAFSGLKKLEDYYAEQMSGYCTAGILKDSEAFTTVQKIIFDSALPQDTLVPNELNPEYFRLPVINKSAIDNLTLYHTQIVNGVPITTPVPATIDQKKAVEKIYSLYNSLKTKYPNWKKLKTLCIL